MRRFFRNPKTKSSNNLSQIRGLLIAFHRSPVPKVYNLQRIPYNNQEIKMKLYTSEELKAMSIEKVSGYFEKLHKAHVRTHLKFLEV